MRPWLPLLTLISLFTLATFFHAVVSQSAPKPLTLIVSPLVGFAPLDLVVLVRLQPIHEDRIVVLIFDTGGFATRTDRQVDGEAGPKMFRIDWRSVGPGETEVRAFLGVDPKHIRATASQRVIVTAP